MTAERAVYVTSEDELAQAVVNLIDWDEELRTGVDWHPRFRTIIAEAWTNHWYDASWLVGCAALGTAHLDIRDNAVGLFIWQMSEAAALSCPDDPGHWPTTTSMR